MNMRELTKLAKAKYGKTAEVRHSAKAPTAEERVVMLERREAICERLNAIKDELNKIGKVLPPLVKAARFVVDVDGDNPSIPQLKVALEAAERQMALVEEEVDLKRERDGIYCHSYRYRVVTIGGLIDLPMATVRVEADTPEQLAEKLGATCAGAV